MSMVKGVKGRQVYLRDEELLRRREENKNYLLELGSEHLLLPYLMEAGRCKMSETPEDIHGGWESPLCELRGHFLGHWLSAAAMHYEATGNEQVRAKAEEIVEELAVCQKDNGGQWAASIPEKYLYWIGQKKPVWAPQYTIHKTFMGLLDMYELAGSKKALDVAVNFGKWFYDWSGKYTEAQFQEILDVETGGMLEIWVILYRITKDEMFRTLMDRYYRKSLFDGLLAGKDVLTNMHANTTIPEILGAAAAYEVTGEQRYLDIAQAYWKSAVTDRGSYVTGGQTCGEIWSAPNQLKARLGDKNQEHCTVYNMMRLADFLFRHTQDPVYLDYWEKNLYNGIMAQGYWQGSFTHGRKSEYPTKGLLTYFLPLRGGAQKAWASKTQDFFCCHGSLVQANAAHNTGFYYEGENALYVCQYFESDYEGTIGDTKVSVKLRKNRMNGTEHLSSDSSGTQKISRIAARYPSYPRRQVYDLIVETEKETAFDIYVRIPAWTAGEGTVCVYNTENADELRAVMEGENPNGEKLSAKPGTLVKLCRSWKRQAIHVELPKTLTVEHLPDQEDMAAFLDGPVVLAGLCDEERILHTKGLQENELLVPDNEREWGNWMGTWKTVRQEQGIRFVPLYQVGYEHYSVYFPVEE